MTLREWKENWFTGRTEAFNLINLNKSVSIVLIFRYIKGCPRLDGEIRKVKYLEDRSGSDQKKLSSKIHQEHLPNAVQYQLGM